MIKEGRGNMKLEKLSIQFQQASIIHSLDLSISKGEIFVLMGPSGSGKTTLLKGIAGLVPLVSGKRSWENGEGTTGLVFQEPRLFPHLTVIDNIAFGLRVKGIPRKERIRRVQEFLTILQLDGLENRYPHQLSGGQQQRVSLGRALILKPELLLLDEPFASLDTQLRVDLIEWLYLLQRQLGFSILWVTHYMDEAFSVADRIGILMDGTLQQIGKPADLFQKPASEKVASFLSLPNRFSYSQWKKWCSDAIALKDQNQMGWIPASAVCLAEGMHSLSDEHQGLTWINGVVKRVRHETKGNTVLIECDGVVIEVEISVLGKVPEIKEPVRVGIKTSYIRWYPKK
jgi:ABC-type sugar transport system ATPase subunit